MMYYKCSKFVLQTQETLQPPYNHNYGRYVIEAALPWMALAIVPSNPLELAITPALHDLDTGNEAKLTWYFKDRGAGCSSGGRALGPAVPPVVQAAVGRSVFRCRAVGTALKKESPSAKSA